MTRTCERCGQEEDNEKYIECFTGGSEPFICTLCFTNDSREEMEKTHYEGKWMEHLMKGSELWTHNADLTDVIGKDGSVCIGIVGERRIVHDGKEYEVSVAQADDLWKDVLYNEYGTNSFEAIATIEGVDKI